MKNRKKVAGVLLAACMMGTSLFGCAGAVSTGDKPAETPSGGTSSSAEPKKDVKELKIGLSMQTLGGAYFATQESSFKEACAKQRITCYTANADGDMTKQQADIEDLIAKGCDVIVINPKDPKGVIPATQEATKAGIAVFIMDNTADPTADYIAMIQSNNYELGTKVGIDVAEHFGDKEIKIGLLSGNQGNALGVDRRMGVMKGILETQLGKSNKTSVQVLTQGWGNWNQEGGLSAAEDMLMAAPSINCIVAENDDMALGALKAVQAAKRSDIVIVGADGQKEMYRLIKEGGQILATGRNDPKECATLTLETVLKWYGGESISRTIYLDPVSVSKKNVDKYYDPNASF